MPPPSARRLNLPAAVHVYCANCDTMLGECDNVWVRITNSYIMPKNEGMQTGLLVSKESRPVPDAQQSTIVKGCLIAEVSCQQCRKAVGQMCTGTTSQANSELIGQTFYRRPRIYLIDNHTALQVEPNFDTEDHSRLPRKPKLTNENLSKQASPARNKRHLQPPNTRVLAGSAYQPARNREHSTLSTNSPRIPSDNRLNATGTPAVHPDLQSASFSPRLPDSVRSKRPNDQAKPARIRRRLTADTLDGSLQSNGIVDHLQEPSVASKGNAQHVDDLIAARLEAVTEALRGGDVSNTEELVNLRAENQLLKKRLETFGTLLDSYLSKPRAALETPPKAVCVSPKTQTIGKRKRQPEPNDNYRPSSLRNVTNNAPLRQTRSKRTSISQPTNGSRSRRTQKQPLPKPTYQVNGDETTLVNEQSSLLDGTSLDLLQPSLKGASIQKPNGKLKAAPDGPMSYEDDGIAEFSDEDEPVPVLPINGRNSNPPRRLRPAVEVIVAPSSSSVKGANENDFLPEAGNFLGSTNPGSGATEENLANDAPELLAGIEAEAEIANQEAAESTPLTANENDNDNNKPNLSVEPNDSSATNTDAPDLPTAKPIATSPLSSLFSANNPNPSDPQLPAANTITFSSNHDQNRTQAVTQRPHPVAVSSTSSRSSSPLSSPPESPKFIDPSSEDPLAAGAVSGLTTTASTVTAAGRLETVAKIDARLDTPTTTRADRKLRSSTSATTEKRAQEVAAEHVPPLLPATHDELPTPSLTSTPASTSASTPQTRQAQSGGRTRRKPPAVAVAQRKRKPKEPVAEAELESEPKEIQGGRERKGKRVGQGKGTAKGEEIDKENKDKDEELELRKREEIVRAVMQAEEGMVR